MEKFKIYDFAHNLKPNKFNFHSNVVAALEGTGFENVIKATEVSRHCYPFLQALLRSLPIDGRAVIVDESSIDLKRLCSKYLGSEQLLHHGDINLLKLQSSFGNFQPGGTVKELKYHVRAYILYIIGSVLDPSPSSSVPALYLQLLRKVKRIGQYAWGAAMLAHLYYHLDTMEESKYCVSGNFHLLSNLDKIISIGSARLACISEKLSLFQGESNGKFKIYDFAHNLKPNKFNFHSNVVAALEGTGFENVIKATEVSRLCYPFLQALLRRYNRRVKCFEFGVNNSIRLFITLGDVLRITGLPIDGRAVIVDESSIDLKRLCSKYLGSEQLLHHGDINLPKLQSSFGNFQPGGTVKELKYHVRAYILYIIGSVLASPSSSVPALYLQLLRKVKRIGQYAWGAAMLAHLYYHLDTMEESKYCVSGNFHLLSMFIFERIPWIVSQLLHPRGPIILPEEVNDRPREFPLMVEWHSKMAMALKNSRSGLKESTFTDFFDQLSEDDVELNPYARLEEDFLPPPYNHQIALERCLTSIICVEKRVLYDPGVLNLDKIISIGSARLACISEKLSLFQEVKAMEKFKIYDFAHNLKPNKFNFHSNVVAALEGTGFENVIKATEVSRHCYPFLQALLRRYNRRVKCFEFGVNNSIRLFITLGDVLRITGLPIDGRAVIVDESSIDLKRLCSKYLGSEQLLHHGDINLPKLQSSFGNFQPGGTVKELKYHVRAYILYIIGSVLAPSPSSSVPALYLQLLRKVKRIGQYAWGAAMLAHLYYHLDTMEESKYCVSGNFHLLSMFIFERIPWIVSQLLHPRGPIILPEEVNDRPREFPLMVEWHSKMAMALKNSRSGLKESTFTDFFDQLSEDDNLDKIISIGSARLACISEKLSLFQEVKAMEKFKIYDFAHNLKPNKFNFHSNVVAALEGTGFENVIKATEVSRHCYPFLQALLRRYNRRVKCFEFGVNNSIRLFITLGDVLRIIGLPIDGRAVIVDESSIDLKRLCSKYLGSEQLLHHGDINLPKLQSSFGNFQPGGTVKELKYHVRAYILYIIGSVLAPSPSSSVPALYLQLLRKVKRIGQYAWGAAMLAHLYYHLDTMEESKYCVSGNFHLLSMFIFERIPWIVSQLLHPRGPIILPEEVNDRPREFPLMVEWHSKMAMALKNSRSGLKESTFTDFFDQLSEDDVELNPYARLEEDFLPPPYNHQIALERCLTSIICVEKRVLYDPGVLVTWRPRNSGPFGDRKKELKKYHSKRIRKRTGHRRNWLKKNEMNIQAWKDSRNYLYDAGVIPGTSPTLFQEDGNLSPQVQIDEGGGGLQQDDAYDAGVLPLQEEDVSTYAEEDVEDDEHGHAVLPLVPATPPAQNTPPAQEPDRAGASTQRPQELLTHIYTVKIVLTLAFKSGDDDGGNTVETTCHFLDLIFKIFGKLQ
ncbi:hypothetical protein GQ457_03G010600 [Hibiscus cannabinus]